MGSSTPPARPRSRGTTARTRMDRVVRALLAAALLAATVPAPAADRPDAVEAAREDYRRAAAEHGSESEEAVTALNVLVKVLWNAGRAGEAGTLKSAEEALALAERSLSRDHSETATAVNNLASILDYLGSWARAGDLFERSLALREAKFGPRDRKVAVACINLARNAHSRGDHERAKSLGERALELSRGDTALLAAGLGNQALLLQDMGDFEEAEKLFARALATWEEKAGPRSPQVASTLNSQAMLFRQKGDAGRAEAAFARSLAIWEGLPDPDPRERANTLNNYGWFKREQNAPERARELLERALKLREEKLGPEHPDTAWTVRNLAVVPGERGERARASRLFERALRSRETTCGTQHPLLAQDLAEWGRFLRNCGETDRAL